MTTDPRTAEKLSDPRDTIADEMTAQLAAADRAYARRAAAAARLDAILTERAA